MIFFAILFLFAAVIGSDFILIIYSAFFDSLANPLYVIVGDITTIDFSMKSAAIKYLYKTTTIGITGFDKVTYLDNIMPF